MKRRAFLGASGIALGALLGGCVSDANDSGQSDTPSPTTTPAESDLSVDNIVVRKAITYESIMGSGGVLAAEGKQYVVASVWADRELSASDFTFETDEQSWQSGLPDTAGAINHTVAAHEGGAVGRRFVKDQSYLAFVVPSPLSATNPRIRFTGDSEAEWPLPDAAVERLAAPEPRFELDSLDVPDTVSQGETLSLSLTASNVSDTDGRFLAAVYWPTNRIADDDESHLVERSVAAGETTTATLSLDTRYTTTENEPVTLSVRGHVTADRTVQFQPTSTPS